MVTSAVDIVRVDAVVSAAAMRGFRRALDAYIQILCEIQSLDTGVEATQAGPRSHEVTNNSYRWRPKHQINFSPALLVSSGR